MNDFLLASATKLASLIRSGKVSSSELVEAHIKQIQKVNPTLNAVVQDRFETARQEAKAADKRTKSGETDLPPFWGVPCTIKESFGLTGMPNTGGLLARKGTIAAEDAIAAKRIRAAGAIPLGVTNISELCMWMESNNTVYGRSRNPYDPSRIVGGSSGGEGAIVGSGASPFGIGSDIGGSIRMPAFFNGVFGHKPTGGLVPSTGQFPVSENEALRYLTTGPICRRAEDLMPILRILAGPDGQDKMCQAFELGDPATVDISKLKVISIEQGPIQVTKELLAAQKSVATALEKLGAKVSQVSLPELKESFMIWSAMLVRANDTSFATLLKYGQKKSLALEMLKWMFGTSAHTLPALVLALAEKLPLDSPARLDRYYQKGQDLKKRLVDRIGPEGVMLYPSYPTVVPKHNVPLFHPFHWVYTAIINVLELPATQVPLGLTPQGLPLGVQVIGTHGQDHVTIAVAQKLEQIFGGWVPPRQWVE